MKTKKILCILSALSLLCGGLVGCDDDSSSSGSSSSEAGTSDSQPAEEPAEVAKKGDTICFMSDYDLNPAAGQDRSIPLTIYEDHFGGKIEWIPTTKETMLDDLSKAVLGGQEVDMFPYTDNVLPNGVSQDLFDPLDDYIDFESDSWKDMKGLADKMAYKGQHYAVPTGINDVSVLIYSRKAVEANGFDDPYELYKNGKWTWEAFTKMLKECSETGCAGDIGKGIMQSTGQPYVTYDGNAFTSNLDNEAIANAGKVQEQIAGNTYDGSWYDTLDDSILFLGVGSWAIAQSTKANKDEDVWFVPFPSEDGSGKFVTADINSKMLVKGSKKGLAVATYLECERMARTNESYAKLEKDAAVKSGMTEEQYTFLQELKNPENVVFDFSGGFSKKISNAASSYKERGAVNNLNDALIIGFKDAPDNWAALRDAFRGDIEDELGSYK